MRKAQNLLILRMKTIILMAVILTATIQTQSQTPAQIQTAQRYRNRPGTEKQAEMRQEAATAAAAESHTPEEWRRIRERQKVALSGNKRGGAQSHPDSRQLLLPDA